ncbi:acyl-CoA dehydrogenase [Pseudonocardia thermophila]|uniref:Acyl-CoA dehydrogenase n=1 Tax=Pseudonocardia thermophila TaxID=1848 RepID=A0A1M6UVD6_PSETH|nr:acyl-CoA dehydrogenase family protein [Pseudonocardia thermophila]SHK73081.1 acyl-CoA dehydrogenase [Pseudonocardia thermophila]
MDPDDVSLIVGQVGRFVRDEVLPLEETIEATGRVPDDLRRKAAEMGLFGFSIPEQYGGLGMAMSEEVRLAFELGYASPAFRSMLGTNNGIAGQVILQFGSEEQRQRYLPRIASGESVVSFALTEAEAGSDPASLRTTARRVGDHYVINGAKRFITNAPDADLFVVFARTGGNRGESKGISAFVVDRSSDGLVVGPPDEKMGQRGALSAEVFFTDVAVPADGLIGEEGEGYRAAMRVLSRGRLHIAAICVGLADRLLDESIAYARSRAQFGRPIGEFQLVQGMLADSKAECFAGRSMVLQAAQAYDAGQDDRMHNACCKYFCSEMLSRVADRAVQIHGGAGYMRGVAVERLYRDARLFRIYEGTSQIQQVIIARALLSDAA